MYCSHSCANASWRARNVHRSDERNEAARSSNIPNKYGLAEEAYLALPEVTRGGVASLGGRNRALAEREASQWVGGPSSIRTPSLCWRTR